MQYFITLFTSVNFNAVLHWCQLFDFDVTVTDRTIGDLTIQFFNKKELKIVSYILRRKGYSHKIQMYYQ